MTSFGPIGLGGMDAIFFELSEMEDELRKAARDTRHAAQQAQVDRMYAQAEHIERAALLSGLGTIASGAGSIAAGGIGLAGTTGFLNESTADASQQLALGSGKATEGTFQYFAGQENAEVKRSEAQATAHGAEAADASDVEQEARSAEEKLARRLETVQNLQNEARNAALRA